MATTIRAVELPHLKDDPHLKLIRPLAEAYLGFAREAARQIRLLRLTPSQFDVIVTLGDTNGLSCSQLSDETLVTKGTLTGVLDRLSAKGLVRRETVKEDRRSTTIRLTPKGDAVYRKVFMAHVAGMRPFFERALTPDQVSTVATLLRRLRDSFDGREPGEGPSHPSESSQACVLTTSRARTRRKSAAAV
ncbi:MAG: MarR family transcriptional regulator [Nitrospiraceae bacterium]